MSNSTPFAQSFLGLPRMPLVKLINQFLHIPEIPHRFPARQYLSVTQPVYEIFEIPVETCRVEHPVDVLFVRAVDHHWMRCRWRLASGRRRIVAKQRDVEKVVLPDRILKVYFVSIVIDNLTYWVQSYAFVIQLDWWPCCPEVLRWKLDLISNLENNLFAASVFCQTGLSVLQILRKSLVSFLQASCKSVCLDFWIQARWLCRGRKLHHWMVVLIRTEWIHPHRHMNRGIVNDFW